MQVSHETPEKEEDSVYISFNVSQTMSCSPTAFSADIYIKDNIYSHKKTAQEDYGEILSLVSQYFQDSRPYFCNK